MLLCQIHHPLHPPSRWVIAGQHGASPAASLSMPVRQKPYCSQGPWLVSPRLVSPRVPLPHMGQDRVPSLTVSTWGTQCGAHITGRTGEGAVSQYRQTPGLKAAVTGGHTLRSHPGWALQPVASYLLPFDF